MRKVYHRHSATRIKTKSMNFPFNSIASCVYYKSLYIPRHTNASVLRISNAHQTQPFYPCVLPVGIGNAARAKLESEIGSYSILELSINAFFFFKLCFVQIRKPILETIYCFLNSEEDCCVLGSWVRHCVE